MTPGKKLEEVRVLFMGRECWEGLPEIERHQIYDLHQQELVNRCKKNFQELLLEKADLFYQFRSSPAGTVTQDDIMEITDNLAEDGRFKALDRMDADRKLLLFQVSLLVNQRELEMSDSDVPAPRVCPLSHQRALPRLPSLHGRHRGEDRQQEGLPARQSARGQQPSQHHTAGRLRPCRGVVQSDQQSVS